MQPFLAMILPVSGGHPDNSLPPVPPGGGLTPSHPIVIPGAPPGAPGSPENPIYWPIAPDQGLPGRPPYPSQGPVRPGRPVDPGWGWGGGEHPSTGPVRPGRPVDPGYGIPELGDLGPAHPWVPPSGEALPPPPADIVDDYVVAVWNPTKQAWTVSVAEGATPK